MKGFFIGLLVIISSTTNAQTKVTKYYDIYWTEVSKEQAMFYADFIKEGSYYNCISYWINTQKIKGKSTFADTVMTHPIGEQILYFKNGHVEDSIFFDDNQVKYQYHYYPNNQLAAYYHLLDNKKEGIVVGYDESGKEIKNYIFLKEAKFKSGEKGWTNYIYKNTAKDLSVKGNKEKTATVNIEFIIDEDGNVIKPKVKKSSGYKNIDQDALQIIANSPLWENAILYNKPVKAYRMQPFIYVLTLEGK